MNSKFTNFLSRGSRPDGLPLLVSVDSFHYFRIFSPGKPAWHVQGKLESCLKANCVCVLKDLLKPFSVTEECHTKETCKTES